MLFEFCNNSGFHLSQVLSQILFGDALICWWWCNQVCRLLIKILISLLLQISHNLELCHASITNDVTYFAHQIFVGKTWSCECRAQSNNCHVKELSIILFGALCLLHNGLMILLVRMHVEPFPEFCQQSSVGVQIIGDFCVQWLDDVCI